VAFIFGLFQDGVREILAGNHFFSIPASNLQQNHNKIMRNDANIIPKSSQTHPQIMLNHSEPPKKSLRQENGPAALASGAHPLCGGGLCPGKGALQQGGRLESQILWWNRWGPEK